MVDTDLLCAADATVGENKKKDGRPPTTGRGGPPPPKDPPGPTNLFDSLSQAYGGRTRGHGICTLDLRYEDGDGLISYRCASKVESRWKRARPPPSNGRITFLPLLWNRSHSTPP